MGFFEKLVWVHNYRSFFLRQYCNRSGSVCGISDRRICYRFNYVSAWGSQVYTAETFV